VKQEISIEDVQRTLSNALGSSYKVTVTSPSTMRVSRYAGWAVVKMHSAGGMTTFRVRGGGFLLSLIVNSLTIAPKVRHTLDRAFAEAA